VDTDGDRRRGPRFTVSAALSVVAGNRQIPAYTRDMSERGVFFYLDPSSESLIEEEFEFIVHFPPELTLSTYLSMQCSGQVVRRETNATDLNGIAAKILTYSVLDRASSVV
jgi:PilZ domain